MIQPGKQWRNALPYALLLLALLLCSGARGQAVAQGTDNAAAVPATEDPYGRETPRGLATGLVRAFASGDYRRAAHYLEPPAGERASTPERLAELAQELQRRLDSSGTLVPFPSLSSESEGETNDGLPIDQERIGSLRTQTGELPLIARRLVPDDGSPYWVVSTESLKALAKKKQETAVAPLETMVPEALSGISVAGAPMADWLILMIVAVIAFLAIRLAFAILLRIARAVVSHPATHRGYQFAEASFPPLGLYLAAILFFFATQHLQVAIVARQVLARYATIVAWIAFVWLLWRLIDMVADLWSIRMARSDRRQAMSALTFVRRAAKSVLVIAAFVAVLDTMNINVTTGIAALGLGGLAIALGVQKTIENLVGSLTVILDQPVRVGDYCKVGDVTGTVEDIGMRSTRLRTNERTVVTIPNGYFSSQQIENYSRRDRFLFNPIIGLTYDTSAEQMTTVLGALRTLLADDVYVDEEARVQFIGLGQSALNIEIFAYVLTIDYAAFLVLREAMLLKIMDTIAAAGANIAFPTQTMLLKRS